MVTPAVAVGVSIAGLFVLLVVLVVVGFCVYLYKHPTVEMTRVREIKKDTSKIKQRADYKRRQIQTKSPGNFGRLVCCVRSRDDDVIENGDGQGDPENIHTNVPVRHVVPELPDDVTLEDPTGHEVTISWSISEQVHVERFQIYKRLSEKGSTWAKIKTLKNSTIRYYRVKGLDSDVRYVFGVASKTSTGKSSIAESVPIVLKQKPVLPGPPSELTAWQKSDTTLTLSWKPPKFDGHLRIIRYHITLRNQNMEWEPVACVQAFDRFMDYRVTGLVQRSCYRFRVSAENDVGIGLPVETKDVLLNTGPMPPDKPKGPLRYADITHNSVVVFWQEPEQDGGHPISGYAIEVLEASQEKWRKVGVVPKRKTSFWVSKLSEGSGYLARVVAINNVGNSQPLMGTKFKTKFWEIPLNQRSVSRMYNLSRRPSRGSSGTNRSVGDSERAAPTGRAAVKRSRSGKQKNMSKSGEFDMEDGFTGESRDLDDSRNNDFNFEKESGFSEFGDSEGRFQDIDDNHTGGSNRYSHSRHPGDNTNTVDVGVTTHRAGYRTVDTGVVTEPGRTNTTDTDGVSTEVSSVSNHARYSYLRNTVHKNVVPSNISYGFR